jgi:hypothetical protein
MTKRKMLVLVIALCGFFDNFGFAAPVVNSVNGTVNNMQSVTINGSAFGEKSSASPLLWDNFERGTVGQSITGKSPVVGSPWTTYTSGSTVPVYDGSVNKTGSTRSSRADYYLKPDYDICLTKEVSTTTGSELFFSYYWYYHKRSTNYADNNKPWMVWGPGGLPMAYVGYGDPGAGDGGSRYALEDSSTPNNRSVWGSTQLTGLNDRWVKIDVYLKQSAANSANGILRYWVNGVLDIEITNAITRTGNAAWNTILLGGFIRQNQPVQIYIDDVYIDNTLARVEIGNASTFSASNHREIQIPTGWSNTSVSVTVNTGTFASNQTAYLYVFDQTGTCNANGYPITIGAGSSDSSPVAPPSGLRIP